VTASARAGEPDRYLSALLAPRAARPHLLALAAFSSELARVPLLVTREPVMGQIRLQWWRDRLAAGEPGSTGSPIADAVLAARQDCGLPTSTLLDVIDARETELAGEPPPDDKALAAHLWKSEGALFSLAAAILHREPGGDPHAAATACGQAYGIARLLLGLPHALSRGRALLPQSRMNTWRLTAEDMLMSAGGSQITGLLAGLRADARTALAVSRKQVAHLPRHLRTAFLPLALVEPYLRRFERHDRDVLRAPAEINPLTRVWWIAAAHLTGRI
jgi:15-cis-phytoene synthase